MSSSNKKYWKEKIERNIKRDEEVNKYYKKLDWKIFRIWEHEITNSQSATLVSEIVKKLS